MTRIKLYDHPLAPVAPQIFEAASIGQWLLDHYGDAPSVKVQVFRGEPCAENEISDDLAALVASDADEYVVLQSPGGIETIFYVVMAVAMVAAIVLMPKPVMPGNVNRSQASPNNSLGQRENKVRMLERVEDIYGTVLSVPSLMMPTYVKYIGHKKYEYGFYAVGRGYYDIAEVRDGDTLIADIEGAAASIYNPFTSPNSGAPVQTIGAGIIDKILTVARKVEVDGITLTAPNLKQMPASGVYSYALNPAGTANRITQEAKNPNFNTIIEAGDSITVSMTPYPNTTGSGTSEDPFVADGTYSNYSGTYFVYAVGDGYIDLYGAAWNKPVPMHESSVLIDGAEPVITDWVTLPEAGRTEVWCNIVAQNGMYKDDGGGRSSVSVSFRIEIERLVAGTLTPTGQVETVTGSLSGLTDEERADTIEHATSWTGPARVRMRRTSAHDFDFQGTVIDEIKWADLYSVTPVGKAEFGNKTTIHTITEANARATAVKSRQLNCIASRKLPTYNGTAFSGAFDATGRHVSGTIAATSKIVDILAAVSVDPKIGARDLATEVDMAQIWGVQQKLDAWNAECGQFNYTFDSDNISFEETVTTIANAGFCIAYRQNGKIRLALDEAQTASTALFTHRNKKPRAETITRTFANDADYDGVEFVYVDPDSNQSETITLPLDGSYTKLKKYEIAGIRSFEQAWLRANRELQKLLGQRITIETETTMDARSLLPNARIDIVDNTRFKSYDGEVIGQNGLELTLSQKVEFTTSATHNIVLMRRDGSLQSIPAAPGSAANKVMLSYPPTEAIVTNYGAAGIRTIYSFAEITARGAQAYLVQELDMSDGQYIKIRAVNYSADYYAMDGQPIPNKAAVIN